MQQFARNTAKISENGKVIQLVIITQFLVIKKALDGAKLLVLVYRKPQLYHEKVQISARNF